MTVQLDMFGQEVEERHERIRRNPRRPGGKPIPQVAHLHVTSGGRCGDVPDGQRISVSITGKPGKYHAVVEDDHRDQETAYCSPMSKTVTTTDPLTLVHAALSEYIAWKDAK